MRSFPPAFLLTEVVPSIRMNFRFTRSFARVGGILFAVLIWSMVPLASFGAATQDIENSTMVRSPEFLDKSAMELLVGATGKPLEPSNPEATVDSAKPATEDLSKQLLPDLENGSPVGFDETMDWVDYEGTKDTTDSPDSQGDGLLEEALNQDIPEVKSESKGSDTSKVKQ